MNELMQRERVTADVQEKVLLGGDLSKLTPAERLSYYNAICDSMQLNPLTRPFEYIVLNGKLVLYARKDCTEQLRKRDNVSVSITAREHVEGVYVVTARATIYGDSPLGQVALRSDESIGAVPLENLKGEAKANAMMKAETKAKRRVTLSISGLGMLDETEIDSIPDARRPTESTAAAVLANKEKIATMNKPEPQAAGTTQVQGVDGSPQASDRVPAPIKDLTISGWGTLLGGMENDPDLADLLTMVKEQVGLKSLAYPKVSPKDRVEFLTALQAAAQANGLGPRVKALGL